MPDHRGDLWIANTVSDLIQGDVHEHLPLEAIPLDGDVLGLGTSTSLDNGELTFLSNAAGNTTIWKYKASDGGIRALQSGDGSAHFPSAHFPYVCFSGDAGALKVLVDPAELGDVEGMPLQELVGQAIAHMQRQGRLTEAPIYGVRAELEWRSLVITVASKLCMGQQHPNTAIASSSTYQLLQHFRVAEHDPGDPADPIRYLRLPWLAAGASEQFNVLLDLPSSGHRIEVSADPELRILDTEAPQANNRAVLEVQL